jgi:Tfp pilus assembly protein PilO
VKKKLKSLDPRIHYAAVVIGLLIFGFVGHMMLVAPQGKQALAVQAQVDAQNTQIFQRKAQLRTTHAPTIRTADVFKLSRAMPDSTDMPGIILAISDVARSAGIGFELIEPVLAVPPTAYGASWSPVRIHLRFNGDFYGLSDFLYRLRTMVAVHDGTLQADGRLLNVDAVNFSVSPDKFPQISAELFLDAYTYGNAVAAATPPPAPTPGADSSSTDSSSTATDGATAAGATP